MEGSVIPAGLSVHTFVFPFSIYSYLLKLESGRADDLHYGLFDGTDMPMTIAQRRATELLWQYLPQPPSKLLKISAGEGYSLCEEGYEVQSISPVTVHGYNGRRNSASSCHFEDFDRDAGQWRAIVFHESSRYTDDIDLFEHAAYLLADDGEIIIIDEFAIVRDCVKPRHPHYFDHFLRLAERFGFECVTSLNLSTQAAPTFDWLADRCRKHRIALQSELSFSEIQLDTLEASCRAHSKKYAEQQYGYFLLRFRRNSRPCWQLGRITSARSGQMRVLFNEIFGHQMSAAHWQWKYGDGRGLSIGVWASSASSTQPIATPLLIAHYGGLVRNIRYLGQAAKALQCCDVMVASGGRASLSRRGPLFLAAATCLEHDIGYGTPHLVGFGFPNQRAYRLPERLGLYVEVGRMVGVTWSPAIARQGIRIVVREIVEFDSDLVDICWRAMATSLGDFIVGERDGRYVCHRYIHHPDKEYRLYAVRCRFTRVPLGVLVLRRNEDTGSGGSTCELLDVIGAKRYMPVLVHHARCIAAQWQCDRLYAWMSDNLLQLFDPQGSSTVNDLEICIPANAWTSGPSIEEQRGRWWLMGGDTDFR